MYYTYYIILCIMYYVLPPFQQRDYVHFENLSITYYSTMVKILLQILKKGTSALPIHPISFLCSRPVRHIERVPAGRVGAQDALEDAALHVKEVVQLLTWVY